MSFGSSGLGLRTEAPQRGGLSLSYSPFLRFLRCYHQTTCPATFRYLLAASRLQPAAIGRKPAGIGQELGRIGRDGQACNYKYQ